MKPYKIREKDKSILRIIGAMVHEGGGAFLPRLVFPTLEFNCIS